MKIEFTDKEKALLSYASDRCYCESYYSYQCGKCKGSANGFVTSRKDALASLEKLELVKWDNYHGLVLTGAGVSMLEEIKCPAQ